MSRTGLALTLAVASASFAPLAPAGAQALSDASVRVDEIFAPWSSVDSPGCAIAVARGGLTLLSRAYGMADLEHHAPNTPGTIFEGGSLSKQFTAATVIRLALDGRLSLDDDVRRWVPEVPDYGTTIALRHLLTHTSGLRDWGSVASISGWGRGERSHTHADVLDIVARQSALNFEPGHEYSYSNTGYNLLAIVAERAGGRPLRELSAELLFRPLGMTSTGWRDDYRRIVEGRSTAYRRLSGEGWEIDRPIEHVYGNGGILTTVGDLTRWNRALSDRRFGPDFDRLMHREGRLSDGSQIVYASGLRVDRSMGVPSITHTGSTAGYRAFLGRYPEQDLSVAMLCNASNVSTGGTGARVARAFLGDAAVAEEPPAPAPVAPEALARLAGLYREPVTGEPLRLTFEDGRLAIDGRRPVVPLSSTELAVGAGGSRYRVEAAPGDGRPRLRVESWESTDRVYEPVGDFRPPARDLAPYEGTYHSDDAETTLVVRVRHGTLTVWRRPDLERALEPLYPDAFDAGPWLVRFRRDGAGAIEALSLSLGRVYDMRFERLGR